MNRKGNLNERRREALELFCKASNLEASGNISEAIDLYSRAFRLDPEVHQEEAPAETNAPAKVPPKTRLAPPAQELIQSIKNKSKLFIPIDLLQHVAIYLGQLHFPSLERLSVCSSGCYAVCRRDQLWLQISRSLNIPLSPKSNYTARLNLIYSARIRTDGLYICRIRYFRPGAQHGTSFTTPVHLVTYYRYLRFWGPEHEFRCISLVTTDEPKKPLIDSLRDPPNTAVHGMCFGCYERDKENSRVFILHLHDPNMRFRVDSVMRMQTAATGLIPESLSKPHTSLTCLEYKGCIERLHLQGVSESVEYDVRDWGKFYFSRVLSYQT